MRWLNIVVLISTAMAGYLRGSEIANVTSREVAIIPYPACAVYGSDDSYNIFWNHSHNRDEL